MNFKFLWLIFSGILVFVSSADAQISTDASPSKLKQSGSSASAESASTAAGLNIRAQLIPKRYAVLSAEIGAKISSIHVREGERFRVGQVLVTFDCALQVAQLEKAKAQVFAAQGVWDGSQRLSKFNAMGEVELRNSEAELLKSKAEQSYLLAAVNKCQISAPYNGRTGEWKAREEQYVQQGQPLLEIVDDSAYELEFLVPTSYLSWLKPGYKFTVLIEDTHKVYPAKFVRFTAKADPVSQTTKVIGLIEGRTDALMAGMSGKVLLEQKN